MRELEAVELLGGRPLGGSPGTWADLGCGEGTFTLALASLLPARSVIHAMDRDASALRHIRSEHAGVSIVTHQGDFELTPWPFRGLDGILLANSLHYVRNPASFIRSCEAAMHHPRRFLIVEYDTDRANNWVPYPVSRNALAKLFGDADDVSITTLGSRASRYQVGRMYAVQVEQR